MALPTAQELTEYITFKSTSGTTNATTGVAATTTTFASAWARITEGGGSLGTSDQQHEIQTQDFEVITQYLEGVTGFMEIHWGTRKLVITGAPQKIFDRYNRPWWIIQAQEVIEQQVS